MDELLQWLKQQNSGIRAFTGFAQRTAQLGETDQANAAHYALLGALAGQFVAAYNGVPLPVDVASRAYARLVAHTEAAKNSIAGSASEKLAFLNDVAATEL